MSTASELAVEAQSFEGSLENAPFTWKTLTAIAPTEFVPKGLRGRPVAILACILTGRELGLGPMESLRSVDIIDGRPSPSGEWMVSRVFDAGHVIYAEEQSATTCTVVGIRRDDIGVEVARMQFTFTIEMAHRAGLTGKTNWKNYPEAMLYWRAVSQLCRQFFPDVLRGIKYLADELGSEDWSEAPVELATTDDYEFVEVDPDEFTPTVLTPDVDPADDVEGWWIELYGIVGEEIAGTIPVIETTTRRMYKLAELVGLWSDDAIHAALKKHYGAAHWSDLGVKANMLEFAERSRAALQIAIADNIMKEEDDAETE